MTAKEIVEKYSSQCLSLNEEMEKAIIEYAENKCAGEYDYIIASLIRAYTIIGDNSEEEGKALLMIENALEKAGVKL